MRHNNPQKSIGLREQARFHEFLEWFRQNIEDADAISIPKGHDEKKAKNALKRWKSSLPKGSEARAHVIEITNLWESHLIQKGKNRNGLSYNETGRYTSVRHETAKQDGKVTVGEAAKIISKALGIKVAAKTIRPLSPEWHHSGFFRNRMGKTWFFTKEQVEDIIKTWPETNRNVTPQPEVTFHP